MGSMGTINSCHCIARPEAKEEKKREKKAFQKIELSGFSLPSPACSQIFA